MKSTKSLALWFWDSSCWTIRKASNGTTYAPLGKCIEKFICKFKHVQLSVCTSCIYVTLYPSILFIQKYNDLIWCLQKMGVDCDELCMLLVCKKHWIGCAYMRANVVTVPSWDSVCGGSVWNQWAQACELVYVHLIHCAWVSLLHCHFERTDVRHMQRMRCCHHCWCLQEGCWVGPEYTTARHSKHLLPHVAALDKSEINVKKWLHHTKIQCD